MDGHNSPPPPPEYLEIKWIPDTFVFLMGLGWCVNYIEMVRLSFRDKTYGMAIIPLCCNLAWEIVYTFVYPSRSTAEKFVFLTGFMINTAVVYAAIRFSPREWGHAPLVQQHLPLIFAIGFWACLVGHLALAAEIGPTLAYSWGAVICQILLSVGAFAQLLVRGNTRGGSYASWLGRCLGSCCTVVFAIFRYLYWPEAFSWVYSPLLVWSLAIFLLTDAAYGLCFYCIRRSEVAIKLK